MPLHSVAGDRCTCNKLGCTKRGKHPRILEWQKNATTDEVKITRWWEIWPAANIGIATGGGSGCVVLDVDPRHGGIETLNQLQEQHGKIQDRVIAHTGGGGFHLYFAHPGGHWANTQGTPTRPSPIGWGLDFRGDGGLVVAPGSDHVSGKPYTWGSSLNGHLPAMPEWLKERLRSRGSSVVLPTDGEAEILPGNRHQALRAWACGMRARGMSKASIRAAIIAENAARFAEPKPDDEVDRLVEWVCRFKPGDVPNWRQPAIEDEPPTAEQVPVAEPTPGLVSIRDVQPQMNDLYYKGAQRGLNTGWENLDKLYSVHPGDLTIVCAAPSAGKTTFGINLAANLAIASDWKIAICSTENRLEMMLADLASMVIGQTYYGNFQSRMDDQAKEYAENFIHDHFRCVTPRRDVPFTMQYVLAQTATMGADGVLVDPFGALVLAGDNGRNDSRLIRDLLHGAVQGFLKSEGIHMWLMVHTTKLPLDASGDMQMPNPYNATDSAGFYNAGDFCFGMRRPKSRGGLITEVGVQKVRDRFSGEIGQCEFRFDPMTGRYLDNGMTEQGHRHRDVSEEEDVAAF